MKPEKTPRKTPGKSPRKSPRKILQPLPLGRDGLNDRERILLHIVDRLYATLLLARPSFGRNCLNEESFHDNVNNIGLVHFSHRTPVPGDLVLATTGHVSRWKLAICEQVISGNEMLVREIGSNNTCRYENESFQVVVGLSKEATFDLDRRKAYVNVLVAIAGSPFNVRYAGIDFKGDQIEVRIRKPYADIKEYVPYTLCIPFKTALKSGNTTRAALVKAGLGTKEFEHHPNEQQPTVMIGIGQNHMTIVTTSQKTEPPKPEPQTSETPKDTLLDKLRDIPPPKSDWRNEPAPRIGE